MSTIRLKNVAPIGDLEVTAVGRVGDNPVRAGEEFDCDVAVAGEAPGVWRAPTGAERAEAYAGLVIREAGEAPNKRTEVLSPGRGLLATRLFVVVPGPKVTGGKSIIGSVQEA